MYNLKKNTYVVVEFTVLDGGITDIYESKIKKGLHFGSSLLIEIAAVKIKRGKISEHYTNFIGIDGLQAENLSNQGDSDMSYYGLTPAHLIGAPSLQETVEKFYRFAQNCTILVMRKAASYNTAFDIFQSYAKSFGYVFNNPVLSMLDIVQAAKLKELIDDKGKNIDYRDILQIAENLNYTGFWPDIFAEYDIFFNPDSKDSFDKGRNDPLSWAIAFAQLFIAIADFEDDMLEEIKDDNTCPF